ncbi:MAG: hypothetical protein WBF45_09235 [Acidobacteriaceae bacterium]|jgi:PleD family two-component response regulator
MLLNSTSSTLNDSSHIEILLVLSDLNNNLYRDEVLRRAGFRVKLVTTAEAAQIFDDVLSSFGVVILSDTMRPEDLFIVSARVRRNSPWTKIVLIEDTDCFDLDPSLADVILDRLDGAPGLVNTVRKLTA